VGEGLIKRDGREASISLGCPNVWWMPISKTAHTRCSRRVRQESPPRGSRCSATTSTSIEKGRPSRFEPRGLEDPPGQRGAPFAERNRPAASTSTFEVKRDEGRRAPLPQRRGNINMVVAQHPFGGREPSPKDRRKAAQPLSRSTVRLTRESFATDPEPPSVAYSSSTAGKAAADPHCRKSRRIKNGARPADDFVSEGRQATRRVSWFV